MPTTDTTTTDALAQVVAQRFTDTPLRIGTRTSPMALWQAGHVADLLTKRVPGLRTELVGIETTADNWPGDLAELGGKGLFTKEIDRGLMAGQVDIAVHCMKDVPGDVPLPPGTAFGAYLTRDDVHDVALFPASSPIRRLEDLPQGAKVATSSVRRRAQLHQYRPDLRIERIRGNVNSRLRKLDEGTDGFEAMILARAGLGRIGEAGQRPYQLLPMEHQGKKVAVLPAVGSGVIGLQARTADAPVMALLDELSDPDTAACVTAERVMLHMLLGHCNSPIAGHCVRTPDGREFHLRGMVFNRDGSRFVHAAAWHKDPATAGSLVAADLLRQGARDLINATKK